MGSTQGWPSRCRLQHGAAVRRPCVRFVRVRMAGAGLHCTRPRAEGRWSRAGPLAVADGTLAALFAVAALPEAPVTAMSSWRRRTPRRSRTWSARSAFASAAATDLGDYRCAGSSAAWSRPVAPVWSSRGDAEPR